MTPTTKRTSTAAAVGFVAALAAAGTTHYIHADGGGYVYEYIKEYNRLHAAGTHVVVDGPCYSSCTMILAYPNACLKPQAVLGFHPAYVPYAWGLLHYSIDPVATKEMRRYYPPDALAIIDARHGMEDNGGWLRPAIVTIKAADLPKRYLCA